MTTAGLQVWNAAGQIVFDSNDRVLREVASFVVTDTGSFNAATWQQPANKIVASTNDAGLANVAVGFAYTGNIQVNAARADTSRAANSTVRVHLF